MNTPEWYFQILYIAVSIDMWIHLLDFILPFHKWERIPSRENEIKYYKCCACPFPKVTNCTSYSPIYSCKVLQIFSCVVDFGRFGTLKIKNLQESIQCNHLQICAVYRLKILHMESGTAINIGYIFLFEWCYF